MRTQELDNLKHAKYQDQPHDVAVEVSVEENEVDSEADGALKNNRIGSKERGSGGSVESKQSD